MRRSLERIDALRREEEADKLLITVDHLEGDLLMFSFHASASLRMGQVVEFGTISERAEAVGSLAFPTEHRTYL